VPVIKSDTAKITNHKLSYCSWST